MNEKVFSYTYSAACNQEVLNIRNKYLPQPESKIEELKRLDREVQNSGIIESLCAGICGCLVFGLGLCLTMKVIGDMVWLGILFALIGGAGMVAAIPIHHKLYNKAKGKHSPRILQLVNELSGNI